MFSAGVNIFSFRDLVLNRAGKIAFTGILAGTSVDTTNDSGIWSEGRGTLGLVAREGDAAAGTGPGVMYDELYLTGIPFILNGVGQTAFFSNLTGTGVSFLNDAGIFATDLGGQVHLIAREGDLFDVNDDPLIEELRAISGVTFGRPYPDNSSGGEDGNANNFNDSGQLAFILRFTDNTQGVFVATIGDMLTGDISGDGFVGAEDLDVLLANWGDSVGMGIGARASGDLSGDGVVGQQDLDILLSAWGDGALPDDVPEPGTFALLAMGGLALLRRRRK